VLVYSRLFYKIAEAMDGEGDLFITYASPWEPLFLQGNRIQFLIF
jgi:hypothetical protein